MIERSLKRWGLEEEVSKEDVESRVGRIGGSYG